MSDRYGITHDGYEFKVNQIAGVTVSKFKTEQEAQQNIEACEQDDLILKTARALVKKAVDAVIRTHHFDRATPQNWIQEAAGQKPRQARRRHDKNARLPNHQRYSASD